MKPLAIDLFCGLGGWAEGFLSEGYDVIGLDIERPGKRHPPKSPKSRSRSPSTSPASSIRAGSVPHDRRRRAGRAVRLGGGVVKPYYQESGITIYNAHWIEVVGSLPLVDCCITDPPYGETSLDWDEAEVAWLSAMDRTVSAHGSVWSFGSLKYLSWLLRSAGMAAWRQAQEIVWEKHNGSNFHADRFKRVHELIVQLYKRSTAWDEVYKKPVYTNDATARAVRRKRRPTHTGHIEAASYRSEDGGPRLMTSVLYERSCHGYAEHPTQKPLGILQTLIDYSCPEKGTVLDLFAGSGSTLVAAAACGRGAVGIEISEEYCEIAAKRLRQRSLDLQEATA